MQAGVQLGQDDRRQQDPDSEMRLELKPSVRSVIIVFRDSQCGFPQRLSKQGDTNGRKVRTQGTFTPGKLLALYEH